MESFRVRVSLLVLVVMCVVLFAHSAFAQANPEPAGWYAGDMHVHRSCGGSPESVSSIYGKMTAQHLSSLSLLADMGNGEVQNPVTDLPLVNGQDDAVSTPGQILHWDAEWHWDATYTQYSHQALGGHIVALGLNEAHQIWDEMTYPIFQWAHAQNAIAGFAHMQYLDNGFPQSLTCCTPVEYPVEVALGSTDFISEDVNGGDSAIQAYYRLLNSGFRPGFAAGTDYPCNSGAIGAPLTYARVAGGSMAYRNWIDAIASGRTVVSLNGHNEFLDLVVNGSAGPGDEIQLISGGAVQVNIRWTAIQSLSGTIELVSNGNVVASHQASVTSASPATLTTSVTFTKSGWLAARRMDSNGHVVHTAALFITVNGAPVRANVADPQFYVQWMGNLLTNTSSGGAWNSYFPTELNAAQSRYRAAQALYQQIAGEAQGTAPTISSIGVTPGASSVSAGNTQPFTATGTYSDGSSLNISGQVVWTSSNSTVATVNPRGLVLAVSNGTSVISATMSGVTGSTTITVQTNPLVITTQWLAGGTTGVSYSAAMAATGGTLPYTWSVVAGSLPTGLSLNSTTGGFTGTPTTPGSYSFTVQAADTSSPQQTATVALSIVIGSSGAGPCPCTIWPSTSVPGIPDSGPDSAVELGVKFRADINGYITGVRFYKGVGNTGTHIGNLWSSSGTQLATATFTSETAIGWQQVSFSSPVPVLANTTYVASYFAPIGHYADDNGYFSQAVDKSPLHGMADGFDGPNGVYRYGSTSSFPNSGWQSSNYWVDVVFMPTTSAAPPIITSVTPANNSSGVSLVPSISGTFSQPMSASTLTTTTVMLLDPSSNPVPATIAFNADTSTVTLTPTMVLSAFTTYTATIRGGSGGVQDFHGNALVSDYIWFFTTGAPPANTGPGGPILVISGLLNPFSRYYGEILNAEGLGEYTVADISTTTSATLANYDVVILGDMALTSSQATMLAGWVAGGGNLIAMHPDKQLAGLLGLTPTSSTLADAYLQVQNSYGPGFGIVGQTIQFHGSADLYALNGASSLATLYSTASAGTAFPAVTLTSTGTGQAAAFTYDLARSVVYTRQGNPAWSGQKRDGQIPPIRSDDLYFGNASFDPERDWVDLNKVSIPQADEQQRLLANLILQMNASKKPLPRFWYFPSGFKAAVIMTGDDHASGGTPGRFDTYIADSAPGCSVADWQCVRATAYIYPSTPIPPTQAASYVAKGFEVALHATTDCSDWTPASLEAFYATQLADFAVEFSNLPAPRTNRTHCIAWSDYDTQPQVELNHGIRLDTNYYYWPPTWVNDQPGFFTGSGMPMRFTDRYGNVIDEYQAATQMTDESGQSYPFTIDSLLDNAVGAQGFYGALTANMHNDSEQSDGADAIIASAQAHGVPVVSALQMLTWLDGRNTSSFQSLSWSSNTLYFSIVAGAGARNLQAMLPTDSTSGTLSAIARNGTSLNFSTQTIKGRQYAFFNALPGSYQATYATGGPPVTLASVTLSPAIVQGGSPSTGTVTLNGVAPTTGAVVTLSSGSTSAQVPGSVTVAAGNTTATFTVTTSVVSNSTLATITGTYGGAQSAVLTINPALPVLTTITVSPASASVLTSGTQQFTATGYDQYGAALSPQPTFPWSVSGGGSISPAGLFTAGTTAGGPFTVTAGSGGVTGTAKVTVALPPPALSSVSLSPTSILGGSSSTGTLTLNGPATVGGAIVTLSSSNTGTARVPASVTVAASATTATFTVATSPVAANTSVTISGTYGITRTTTLTVTAATLSSISGSPSSVVGGNSSTGTVTLNGPAPAGGAIVTLSSSNTGAARVPASVTVAASATTATFTVATSPVAANTSVTISGTYGATRTVRLTVAAPVLSAISVNPASVKGGSPSTGMVTLNGAAPGGGAVVKLSSSPTSVATVPSSVMVPPGGTSARFTITTRTQTTTRSVTISATEGGTLRATLTVTP